MVSGVSDGQSGTNHARPPAEPPAAQASPEAAPLIRGHVIEDNLASGETRHYQVSLTASEFAVVMVGRVGVELHVAVASDDGRRLEHVAGWDGISRTRPVLLLADAAAICHITMTNHKRRAGAFFVHLTTHRPATVVDRQRFTAFETFQAAQQTRRKNTKPDLEMAVTQLHEALTLTRQPTTPTAKPKPLSPSASSTTFWARPSGPSNATTAPSPCAVPAASRPD